MTGEEIRAQITSDYQNARTLLENSRFFRVTTVDENGEGGENDFPTASAAIEFFEDKRDESAQCFLDVMTRELEFKGKTFPVRSGEIANHEDQRLRKELNYVQVQQFNRAFIAGLLESLPAKMTEQEARIGKKIIAELLQTDYPL